ncbi:MAG TPA: SagB/ThcOx family dehydrogenase [Paenibacillus sp.]|uniref:SagB/ThcOx family dehydrogenase n=1 Tax=Paenibacillus TaxID=44249 RepID=UPI000B9FD08C|nr:MULTISPECIES: SagB/ThcOx family dehydrogenase [Paenibacillus]OZQ66723.1 hypothetical protein CA599_18245 [Paenibacillus taichungensis]HBU84559.1 SagB/ThcOx family dehydrogenase [Paenibacillus sp.]
MKNKNTGNLEHNTVERSFTDYIYFSYIPKKVENYILKFHQSSTLLKHPESKHQSIDDNVIPWLEFAQYTDITPNYYEEKISLDINNQTDVIGSCREFEKERLFNFIELSELLNEAFIRDGKKGSKKYGSAGALYPIVPLLLLFKDHNGLSQGVYVYDGVERSLLKIKSWSNDEAFYIKKYVCHEAVDMPESCIAYAADIRRAIIKYHIRGYRHALIEVGAMSQVLKNSLHKLKNDVGEVSWSGFNDNELTKKCGLNVRLCPIVMLQWFGHTNSQEK